MSKKPKKYTDGRLCVVRVVVSEVSMIPAGTKLCVHPKEVERNHCGSMTFLRQKIGKGLVPQAVAFTFLRHATNEEWRGTMTGESWDCAPMTDEEMGDDSFERAAKKLDPEDVL